MPPDHDHFSGSVNLDDAEPLMRELVLPVPAGLGGMPGRETADPDTGLSFAPAPDHPAEQAPGTT